MDRHDYLKQLSASSERNKDPILDVLKDVLPERGLVLEIASGTGQHAAHFAAALSGIHWQPSDIDPELRASVSAWREDAALDNLLEPIHLDVTFKNYRPAELLAYLPIVERTTAHSVRFTGEDMVEVFRFLEFMLSYRADLEP